MCDIGTMDVVQSPQELGVAICEARLGRGLTQEQLAKQAGIERTALTKIEAGARGVAALELVRIASALSVTVPDLVFVAPEPVRAARRAVADEALTTDSSANERAAYAERVLLDRTLRDAMQLRELGHLSAEKTLPSTTWGTEEAAVSLASAAREVLSLDDRPLPAIADVCERFGLWVFAAPIRTDDGLSASPDPGFGVALVNADLDPGRRRATAAHELGHHLSGDSYSRDKSVGFASDEREKLIDAFAAELLLPTTAVRRAMSDAATAGERRERLVRLCVDYRASWSLGTRRLDDLGLDVEKRTDKPTKEEFDAVVGTSPAPDLLLDAAPKSWVRAVSAASARGQITPKRHRELIRPFAPMSD